MKHVFFDTNIILDVLTRRQPFYNSAATVLYQAECKEIKAWMSATTWTTLYYIARKQLGTEAALQELAILRTYCDVAPVTAAIIDSALHAVLTERSFADLEDAVQLYSAIAVGASCIITRNGKDFLQSSLPIHTADEYLLLK